MNKNNHTEESDDRIFTATDMWDACYEMIQAAMAAAFEGHKTIEGKSVEDFITAYIDELGGS